MVRRERKRWEDIAVEQIGRREARTAFYRDSAPKNDIEWSVELFISRSAGIIS